MKISQMPLDSTLSGVESIPIYDPNEPNAVNRNKRINVSLLAGENGATGPAGASAYQVWLNQGNTGTVEDFFESLKGDSGDSAYQTWADAGNIGTEAEFLTSLRGEDGESNYQIWLDAGNTGSEEDFLETVKGDHGTTWYIGSGVPDNALGIDGDFYINNDNSEVYQKLSGDWGTGLFNIQGADGSTWISGLGPPDYSFGNERDFYLDQTNGDVYGPKLFGNWNSPIINLTGPQGIQGIQGVQGFSVLSGHGVPDDILGVDGDQYIDIDTGEFYDAKASGTWGTSSGVFTTTWDTIPDKPVTRDGYGLTDVYTETETDTAIDAAITALGSPFHYVGGWNASTNTPTLDNAAAIADRGAIYRVTTAGTIDFGSGAITFAVNDRAVSTGTTWEKWDVEDPDNTDDLNEGATNLYFTDQRAQDAVGNILVDGDEIDFTYDDATPNIAAALKPTSIANSKLVNDSVTIGAQEIELGSSVDLDDLLGLTTDGFIKRDGSNTLVTAVPGTDYAPATNGTNDQVLTSDGAGGFGTPVTLGTAAYEAADTFEVVGAAAAALVAAKSYTDDKIVNVFTADDIDHAPSSDLVKTSLDAKAPSTNGTDGQILTSDGAGGFGAAITLGTAALSDTSAFDIAGAATAALASAQTYADDKLTPTITSGDTDHAPTGGAVFTAIATRAPSTTGTDVLKGDGSGGTTAATVGTDYTEPTNGTDGQILTSDGAGGFGDPIDPGSIGFTPGTDGQFLTSNGAGGFGDSVTLGSAALEDTTAFEPAGAAADVLADAETYADGKVVTILTGGDTTHAPSSDTVLDALISKLDTSEVGVSVAPLVGGVVPAINLPSYVDDVIEVADFASLPVTGETGKIYITQDTEYQYRWSGSIYIQLVSSPGSTDNVPEGTTNLYYTNARARAALGSTSGILKGNGSGTVTAAVEGEDYSSATNGTENQILTSDGDGGFGTPLNPSDLKPYRLPLACGDEVSVLTTGVKIIFRAQCDFTLTDIKASLNGEQTSGSLFTVDVKQNGDSVFSTLLTFDNGDKTTKTATTPAVLSTTSILDDDEISVEITQVGDDTAIGLKVYFNGYES